MLSEQFNSDREAARIAEQQVLKTFTTIATGYTFEDVSDVRQYRYKGDILATAADGRQIFIEVKNDSDIAATGRVLCEEENFMKEEGNFIKGNMHCDSDIYCVVSESQQLIYVMDFKVLKQIYKRLGEYKQLEHRYQDTFCYLLDLCWVKKYNGLIAKITFEGELIK